MTATAAGAATPGPSEVEQAVATLGSIHAQATYLLYAMGLWLRTLDTQTLEVDNLLDGSGDKKVDFFHIDAETGVATIAQGYETPDWTKTNPPANKASDLNSALSWLLQSDLATIPTPNIRVAAEQLRDALKGGTVRRVDVLFVHNLAKNKDVDEELGTTERLLNTLLVPYGTAQSTPTGRALQLDVQHVEALRRSLHDAIAVTDELKITSTTQPVELSGPEWRAVSGTVGAERLIQWHGKYGDDLFNANIRDYLGSRETARNINKQIQKTALEEAQNFWIFNNGITILTNNIGIDDKELTLGGASIINGAQTTGSLSDAANTASVAGAEVPFRAIECRNQELVERIIRFNNLQNPVTAWDRRSIDPLQVRLREALETLGVTYQLRRGSGRRKATDVHFDKLAPYMTAFYGDPIAAANKSEVFESETRYRAAFLEGTDVRHYLFVYRLGEAVAAAKLRLRELVDAGGPGGEAAEETYKYFRYGTFSHLVITTAARILGVWLEGRDSAYRQKVALAPDPTTDLAAWDAVLEKLINGAVLPALKSHLSGIPDADIYTRLKTLSAATDMATAARGIVEQVQGFKPDTYSEITDQLTLL